MTDRTPSATPRPLRQALRIGAALTTLGLMVGCATTAVAPRLWEGFADHPAGYLTKATTINATNFLPRWPAAGSPRGDSDRAIYRATRQLQGSPRWTLAIQDAELDTPRAPYKAFACALGVEIDPASAPTLTRLLGSIQPDVDLALNPAKLAMPRPRPFVSEDRPICVAKADWLAKSGSYPSGHSAAGWAWGLTLSRLAPDRQEAILKRAMALGESRVVCGVHYASDVEAGRVVGAAVVAELQAHARYQADLVSARRELTALRRQGHPPAHCQLEAQALSQPAY
ncbi:phosphatase PAP2 family protein [soil metagenome]